MQSNRLGTRRVCLKGGVDAEWCWDWSGHVQEVVESWTTVVTASHTPGNTNIPARFYPFLITSHKLPPPCKIAAIFVHPAKKKKKLFKRQLHALQEAWKHRLPVRFTWKCMTVRIIAVSNPPGLRRVPALLMRDNCQGDEQAATKPRRR